ncbi:MAG: ribosome silencing factor, partial [Bdellovibrio sp.]
RKIVDFCAQVLFEKKAVGVRAFDLSQIFYPCEYALVASGTSTRHAQSLAENVSRSVKEEFGIWPQGTEGLDEGRWVVLDYGSVMVHVFYDFVRQEYSIEHMWSTSQEISLQEQKS